MVIIIAFLYYAAFALNVLQDNAITSDEEELVVNHISDYLLLDSLLNMYLLLLGEFFIDGYEKHPNTTLCYSFFVFITFMLLIIFVNMLIAVMADTYDRVIEGRKVHSLKNKLNQLATMACLIHSQK